MSDGSGVRTKQPKAASPAASFHRPQELERLDELHVLEAERVTAAGHDVGLVREGITGEDLDKPVGRLFLGEIQAQLVELLVVPRRGTFRSVQLEGHRALRAEDRA